MQYKTRQFTINEQALSVVSHDGKQCDIRPKTCQLLLVLLKNTGKLVTKKQLLAEVWNTSVVDEQVIFQSIKEIRALFGDHAVIKTLPKQGYIWLPKVVKQTAPFDVTVFERTPYLFLLLFIISIVGGYFMLNERWLGKKSDVLAGSIVVLPTMNLIEGHDHSWVRLGMMDQVIQRLPSHSEFGILQTDYVLEVLDRAKAPIDNIDTQHINTIFKVSGAELLISTRLSGSPHDYQLSYTFYHRNAQTQGVLFSSDTQVLVDKLVNEIHAVLGATPQTSSNYYHRDFESEMLGAAIDFRLNNNYRAAKGLLETLVLEDNQNLTAQRLFIDTLFNLQDYETLEKQLEEAILIAKTQNDPLELIRLTYFQSLRLLQLDQVEQAELLVLEAFSLAQRHHDWLFMAYLTDLKAHIAITRGHLNLAAAFYRETMSYHRVLKCPVGESSSWINLGLLAKKQNDLHQQTLAFTQAKNIAKQRGLHNQLAWIEQLENK